MADNFTTNAGSGGDTFAADEISGVKHQRVKAQFGADGSATDVSSGNPLPITLSAAEVADGGTIASKSVAIGATDGANHTAIRCDTDGAVHVADGGNSLSVDDGGGTLSVDDGGGTLSVDGTVSLGAGTAVAGKMYLTDGTHELDIDASGRIPVTIEADNAGIGAGVQYTEGDTDATITGTAMLGESTVTSNTTRVVAVDDDGHMQVDVLSGGTASTQYAMDTAAGSTDQVIGCGLIRDDSLSTLSQADGDWVTGRVDSTGAMWVRHSGTVAVTDNGVTLSVDDGAGSLTVDSPALTTIAGAVSGSEMQVDIVSQPALARTTDSVAVATQTDAIANGTTMLPLKFAKIDISSSGDNSVVAAVAAKKIRIVSITLLADAAVDLTIKTDTGTGAVALSGAMTLVEGSGFAPGYCPVGHFQTDTNEALNFSLSSAVQVSGFLTYVEV